MKHSKVRIPEGCWVAVCDGGRALLLKNKGDAQNLNLVEVETLRQQGVPTHEMGTDRPGRVTRPFDSSRSAVEETDLHEKAEIDFLATVMDRLENAVRTGAATRIVLVAPPRVLGRMRSDMPRSVREAIEGELASDLAHYSVGDIEQHLSA